MTILVTGSSGHLGEALVRTLQAERREVLGIDVLPGAFTQLVGSITDRGVVRQCMKGVTAVLHAATLHKPHVATHSRQDFVDVNITGTLNLLEEATAAGVTGFVYTSTTSVFGDALVPPPGEPAAWVTEDVIPVPKNIYGVTKAAAEDLCQLFARNHSLGAIVLRTSRFFPEEDDNRSVREGYADANLKANEFLHRRVDLEDVVSAHLLAISHAPSAGFAKYIISATTPFSRDDTADLRSDLPLVLRRYVPGFEAAYARRGWTMASGIDRVYVNAKARAELGWQPRHDFHTLLARLQTGDDIRSPLARQVGSKGYHDRVFHDGPYPLE
ncbi:NAD(P)-dependent oxidoreductase [Bradyrhizobium sp. AUGA SZCCT0169]|uniref:NAD-dependent epimerase/dehydratase family protein n=1 Tax=Bradyrhizobium sp. AUGA SZCCT0169 TaxID=2807663 RepID=UPI001BA88FE8|nr:NAD(P)-dependent oxidoreductase [Bradyrhizobium sp. AUGA SZCCT0169]MBR1245929.1 NAD(P)-dependent oxidoreductase [Bradyrhizobium sp. AUGA SZCCT0169]